MSSKVPLSKKMDWQLHIQYELKKSMNGYQHQTDPDDEHPDKLIVWARRVFIAAIAFAGIIIIFYVYKFKGEPYAIDAEKWGQVGDFIGGTLNPLIGGATIFLLFIGLIVQRRELKDTSEALKKANQHAAQQAFEQSLFSWLDNCRELIKAMEAQVVMGKDHLGMDVTEKFMGKALLRAWYEYGLKPSWSDSQLFTSDTASEHQREIFLSKKVKVYESIFQDNRSELDAYLRTMFRLFEWIDGEQHTLTKKQRWHYACLVRAQISWSELVIHFYNGFTEQGKAFVEYYDRYAFFDNISTGKDLLIDHVAKGLIKKYSYGFQIHAVPYKGMAFSSDLARKNLGM